MSLVSVPTELMNAVAIKLAERPYNEVAQLMRALQDNVKPLMSTATPETQAHTDK